MTTDLDQLLRDANPLQEVDPLPPAQSRQLIDLAVARAPQDRHRSRGRSLALAAGVVGVLTVSASALTTALAPPPASAGIELTREGDHYRVTITDPERDADELTAALRSYGFDIRLELVPASPSLVGSIIGGSFAEGTDDIEELNPVPCLASRGCEVGFRVPVDWQGEAALAIARQPRPDEDYASTTSSFDAGEALACLHGRGQLVDDLLPVLARRGLGYEWRSDSGEQPEGEYRDWYVDDVFPRNGDEVFLFVTPTPPAKVLPGQGC
jgi:hypothetical protein